MIAMIGGLYLFCTVFVIGFITGCDQYKKASKRKKALVLLVYIPFWPICLLIGVGRITAHEHDLKNNYNQNPPSTPRPSGPPSFKSRQQP